MLAEFFRKAIDIDLHAAQKILIFIQWALIIIFMCAIRSPAADKCLIDVVGPSLLDAEIDAVLCLCIIEDIAAIAKRFVLRFRGK